MISARHMKTASPVSRVTNSERAQLPTSCLCAGPKTDLNMPLQSTCIYVSVQASLAYGAV